jgi:hypothetical protein
LARQNRSERVHYVLSVLSIGPYVIAISLGAAAFRPIYLTVMLGLYLYDLAVIAREGWRLKPSYVRFYTVHHLFSFAVVGVWLVTFEHFTMPMATAAVIWMSSDVWRWCEQIHRLGGGFTPARVGRVVFWLERVQRLLAYGIGLAMTTGRSLYMEEVIFLLSAILMDVVDTTFQMRATARRKKTLALVGEVCQQSPAFQGVDPDALEAMAERMSVRTFGPGDALIKAGHEDDRVFVLLDGEAEVRTLEGETLAQLHAGSLAGEMRMVTKAPRSASVVAVSKSRAAEIGMQALMHVMANSPDLQGAIWKTARLRMTRDQMRHDSVRTAG